jgi:homoserine O-acetyltransferase
VSGAPSGHELTPDNLAPLSAARAGANAEPKAKATIIARQTALYFTVEDMKAEAAYVSQARFRVIPSLWGHMAGAGLTPADSKLIER